MMNRLLLTLSALVLSAAICQSAEITLEEILAMHEEASQVIRSGHISYTIEHRESEREIRDTMVGVREEDVEVLYKINLLRRNYTEEINLMFDADIAAFKEVKTYKHDLAKVVDGLNVSEDASFKEIDRKLRALLSKDHNYRYLGMRPDCLHETQASSALDGSVYETQSEGALLIRKDYGHRPYEYLIRRSGFISPYALEGYKDAEITESPDDPNLVILRFKNYGEQFEYVLDRSLGYRITSWLAVNKDGYSSKAHYEYRTFGDCIFLAVREFQHFYPDGEFREGSRLEMKDAEFNIPIDKSECKLEPPPGGRIYDAISGTRLLSREEMAQEVKKAVDALLPDNLLDDQTAASLVEEPAVVQEEAVEEEPEEPQAAPARETGRDGGFWIVCAVLLIAVVAVLASVMRKKRQ